MTRAWLVFAALMLGVGVGLAVAAALPLGPTADVQVVPLAYGSDPLVGTPPSVFGLGVRHAHCSGGATGYTLVVRRAAYNLSCASSSGTRPRPVMVGLRAAHSYTVTITAIQKRAGRSTRPGNTHTLSVQIPDANSKSWRANP
jgi:hypothetical protein